MIDRNTSPLYKVCTQEEVGVVNTDPEKDFLMKERTFRRLPCIKL